MGVLQDFERRLEGAVEGFFARAFRSGLQPIDLARAIQRYAQDNRHVTEDGVVVPNVYHLAISSRDADRLSTYGEQLAAELAGLVERTATEKDWRLRGPAQVDIDTGDVRPGQYELTGRVKAGPRPEPAPSRPAPAPAPPPATSAPAAGGETMVVPRSSATPQLQAPDGQVLQLRAGRHTIGRLADCDLHLDDTTVSREHAAVVRRGETWWVLDLGSTNGTRVNGVSAAEHPLSDGDHIEVGEVDVTYRVVR